MIDTCNKKRILGIDFACTVLFRPRIEKKRYEIALIDRMMGQAAQAGFTTIHWRVAQTGRVTYHSKVRTPSHAEMEFSSPTFGNLPESAFGGIDNDRTVLTDLMKRCDPLEHAVAAARKHGLEIVIYTTLFDESIPTMEAEFNFSNPQFCWRHRHFEHYNPGLLSYGYPEVREYKLAEVKELIGYGADGVYLDCARSHSGLWPLMALPYGSDIWANYGFNDVECEEFEKRFGYSPRLSNLADYSNDQFDWDAWQKLRGEYLTMFIRDASSAVRSAGQSLSVGFYTDAENYLSPAGERGRQTLGGLHIDWEAWANEKLIDEIILACEHRRLGDHDWITHSAIQFKDAQDAGLKVSPSVAVEHRFDELQGILLESPISIKNQTELFWETLQRGIRNILNSSADGVYCYEHARIEEAADLLGIDYWGRLKKAFNE